MEGRRLVCDLWYIKTCGLFNAKTLLYIIFKGIFLYNFILN